MSNAFFTIVIIGLSYRSLESLENCRVGVVVGWNGRLDLLKIMEYFYRTVVGCIVALRNGDEAGT